MVSHNTVFKQKRSTATCGLTLQSILTRALDQGNYAIMSSIDLSAVFNVVNVKLLLKRLKIIGLPEDVIKLIKIWLRPWPAIALSKFNRSLRAR